MPSSPLDLSIVIVNWNTRRLLGECLGSLEAVLAHTPVRVEIIVVDNGSTDGSPAMVAERFLGVRLICNEENRAYAGANNQGIALAGGRNILLLNSDTVVRPGALEEMMRSLEADPRLGGVSPKLLNPDGSIQRSCWPFPMKAVVGNTLGLYRLGLLDDYRAWDHREDREVDWVSSACLMVPRRVFDAVGGLDERFFYGVDVEWAHRAAKAGYRFRALARPEVVHHGRGSQRNGQTPVSADGPAVESRYFRAHYGLLGVVFFRAVLIAGTLPRLIVWEILGRCRLSRHAAEHRAMLRRILASALSIRTVS
jgi:GT2 family glycosyltransferase